MFVNSPVLTYWAFRSTNQILIKLHKMQELTKQIIKSITTISVAYLVCKVITEYIHLAYL